MKYFVYLQDSDGLECQDWKSLSNLGGFKLFQEGHVQDLSAVVDNVCHVKGKCLPEMKKDHIYPIHLYVDVGRNCITGDECTCPAGHGPKGSCKHIVTVCFALEDYVLALAIAGCIQHAHIKIMYNLKGIFYVCACLSANQLVS